MGSLRSRAEAMTRVIGATMACACETSKRRAVPRSAGPEESLLHVNDDHRRR